MVETIRGNLYDYPQYYDLVYGSDWKAERDFLRNCFRKHATARVHRVFEPACGTGRLMYRLARAGYEVSGLDLNPRAVAFCNQRLQRHGFPPTAVVGDMSNFRLRRKVDAAFNMVSSFRHLPSEQAARDHLACVARALRRGGIYVLGLHLTPTSVEPMTDESWSARRGNLCVNVRMEGTALDLRRRQERYRVTYDVFKPTRSLRIEDAVVFRTYTRPQMLRLIASVQDMQIAESYDFAYEIDRPIELGDGSEDVVFVLHKT